MNPFSDKNWSVGALLAAGLLLVIAPYRAAGQSGPAEDRSNIGCLERLETPDYPALPRQARIQVTQIVTVLLSDQATVQNVDHTIQGKAFNLETFFKDGAEKALKNSRFSKTCGGKTVTLVFHYKIRNNPNSSSLFAFEPPNHFWIRYGPVYVNPSVSVKSIAPRPSVQRSMVSPTGVPVYIVPNGEGYNLSTFRFDKG